MPPVLGCGAERVFKEDTPMRLHFDLALVRRLLDHSKAATERRPSLDQLYEGRFRRDGKDADLDNLTDNRAGGAAGARRAVRRRLARAHRQRGSS